MIKTFNKITYKRTYFYAALALYLMVNVALLVMQLTQPNNLYESDLPEHLGGISSYSLFNILISFFKFLWPKAANILVITSLASANLFSILICNQYFHKKFPNANQFKIDFLTLAVFLVSMILPLFNDYNYWGIGTPNLWHNSTNTFCRPFVLLSLFKFFSLYEDKEKFNAKQYILFVVFITLCTFAKPSFTIVFVPALAVVLLAELIKTKFKSKSVWIFASTTAAAFLPSLFIMLFQSSNLFGESSKLIITWGGAWKSCLPKGGLPVAIVFAAAFPLYAILVNIKRLKTRHILTVLVYLFGMLSYWLVAEEGSRFSDSNMMWGYLFGLLLLFITAMDLLFFSPNKLRVKIPGYILFSLHLISGIIYYGIILSGSPYL